MVSHRRRISCGIHVATLAIMMGGHARVGMEDNIFVEKGVLAKAMLTWWKKVVRIAKELGREIATPDEARKILGLKGKDKVNYLARGYTKDLTGASIG